MKLVIFGLSISSSWGNGHATLWRGLCKAMTRLGHSITFFEKDTPYYRAHRDLQTLDGCDIRIYEDWLATHSAAREQLREADVGIVTSYCPDALDATRELLDSKCVHVFYDLDTPVTLSTLQREGHVAYIGPRGFRDFDLVLSFTGGSALKLLETELGARTALPLYGSVDPGSHKPVRADQVADLSYLGTYAADRQEALQRLFLEPAQRLPHLTFMIGGAQYPTDFSWSGNILFKRHVEPADHPRFFCSSGLTLNITRQSMAAMGHCPSGRLFEAAACGVPIVTDWWEGLDDFYEPGREILRVFSAEDVVAALSLPEEEKRKIGEYARERTLSQHTALHRAKQLEQLLERFVNNSSLGEPTCGESSRRQVLGAGSNL